MLAQNNYPGHKNLGLDNPNQPLGDQVSHFDPSRPLKNMTDSSEAGVALASKAIVDRHISSLSKICGDTVSFTNKSNQTRNLEKK